MASDEPSNPGELREDIPLRPSESSGFARKLGGIRLIIASFAVLSIAVTIALATQIYNGDFEVVPHGSVATDSKECSIIGTDILKMGGNAVDAAIAASFCLAVVNPHSTGLDAIGTMMYYDYRKSRAVGPVPVLPTIVDFSGDVSPRVPQLIKGLAFIHEKFGSISWYELVMPAANLAKNGFSVPSTLFQAIQTVGNPNLFNKIEAGGNITIPNLGAYLTTVANTSTSLFITSPNVSGISMKEAISFNLADSIIYMPMRTSTSSLIKFLNITFGNGASNENFTSADTIYRTAYNLKMTMPSAENGPSSTVAVIDTNDVYVSLTTGLSVLLGSQSFSNNGFLLDVTPAAANQDLSKFTPLIMTSDYTCGKRVVLSCGEILSAAQVIGTLLKGDQLYPALENPRLRFLDNQHIAYEKSHSNKFSNIDLQALKGISPLVEAPEPYPTCNAVQQIGDDLTSHSDSRGGGVSSRF